MKHIILFEEFNESETGKYEVPKFVIRPSAEDSGYDLIAKEFGAPLSPRKKKKNSKTQEIK